jgi:hypothetical protein
MFGINPYVIIAALSVWIGSTVGAFFYGEHVESLAQAKTVLTHEVKQQNKTIATQKKSGDLNTDIGKHVDEEQQKPQIVYRDVYHEIQVRLPADADSFVTCGFVRLHDHAASGNSDTSSICAGKPDHTPSDVKLSEVVAMFNDNYNNVCKANAAELAGWQEWYAKQKALLEEQNKKKTSVLQHIF